MPPKLTQPLRPAARYRPGKAPVPLPADDSSDDDDNQQQQQHAEDAADEDHDEGVTEFAAPHLARKDPARINVALREVEVDHGGKVRVGGRDESGKTQMESSEGEYETDSEDEAAAPPKPVFRPKGAPAAAAAEESSEYETDSEEEEEPVKPLYKPVFVSKRNRDTVAAQKKELDPAAIEAQQVAEAERRRFEAKTLVADSIVREIAQKEAQEVHPDVDDTDGLDPEGEFEAWKLRELQRLKRDREERYALEKVREEVEARRALPEELRLKEDTERADKSRKEKKKGQQVFLQRYHHKGVFHQELDVLKKHDYTAPTESTVTDVSSLPAVMQKRNFGKAHQTKYTHLAAEDTSRQSGGFGRAGGEGGGAGGAQGAGCFVCGGPHLKRDCPQLQGGEAGPSSAAAASGANSSVRVSGGDAGWAARAPPPSRDAPLPGEGGGGGGSGRRQGIGYGAERREGGERGWRERDDRERRRSRSRSPPPTRERERRYDPRDERAGGGRGERSRSRERDYRRRSRSPPPPPRRDERGYGGRDERERDRERERYGGGRDGDRDRDRERERDEKRRRLE